MSNEIGVFDSGFGGISVLKQLQQDLPHESFIYYGDSKYAPYGNKSKEEIIARCIYIVEFLIKQGVKAIVVACNSATSACIDLLREHFDIPLIGMEPALKVLADKYHHQSIVVMATKFTLAESKFAQLIERCKNDNTIIAYPCPKLVEIIEKGAFSNRELVTDTLNKYKEDLAGQSINGIVLGCTHFVFFKEYIKEIFKDVEIVDGNIGTSKQLQTILKEHNLLCSKQDLGSVIFYNSLEDINNKTIESYLLKL